jgi:hypothetical protein
MVLIFVLPFSLLASIGIFPIMFTIYFIFNILLNIITVTIKVLHKIINLYNVNHGFYDIMSYFLVIVIKPLLTSDDSMSIGMDVFIYDLCGINMVYKEDLMNEVNNYFKIV